MHPLTLLLHLAAAVMLLLWAVRMVRTGVERAHGPALRAALRKARGGLPGMAAAGLGLAVVLQSGTAVALLAGSFAASGVLGGAQGIAALLGADLGSALVVRLLSLDLSALMPVLIFTGAVLFLKVERRRVKQTGRILLGIGFVLLSLQMMAEATDPLRHSAALPQIVRWLEGDPLTAFCLSALFAWGVHSSVATVLLLSGFAAAGVLPAAAALPMVLGANLGGAAIAVWLLRSETAAARRIPMANLAFRAIAALTALPALPLLAGLIPGAGGAAVVNAHLAFNLALAMLALPFVRPMDRLMTRLLPEGASAAPGRRASALDRRALSQPGLALGSARRELVHMGETLARMLGPAADLFGNGPEEEIARLQAMDAELNAAHTGIKLYLAELHRAALSAEEAAEAGQLVEAAINLEHAGDLVAKTLLPLARDTSRLRQNFSPEGWVEIQALHARASANLQLTLNLLLFRDVETARMLAEEKEIVRAMVRDSRTAHLERLREGRPESLATSDIHIEALRALKEVNSLLVAMAYPILAEAGQLLESRLALPAAKRRGEAPATGL